MPTLKDQLEELTKLKHRLAVWEAIHATMGERFLSKDGRPAPEGLRVPNCPIELVSEDTVEDVLQNIAEGPISDIQTQIDHIENREVIVGEIEVKV